MTQFSTNSAAPLIKSMPTPRPKPLNDRLRIVTTMPAPLTVKFWLVAAVPAQSIVIDLVKVTPPKTPESRQLISPSEVVASWAAIKVRHGAAKVHAEPLPVDDTKVFSCSACAGM